MPSPAVADDIEVQQPKLKALTFSAMKPAETRFNSWSCVIEAGTTREQLLQSTLWSVVSERLQFLDRISCIWSDRSAYCELLVLAAGRGHATVHLLHYHQLPALLTADPGALPVGFDCKYAGPVANAKGGYQIIRLVDSVIMTEGHSSRESALQELLQHASLR